MIEALNSTETDRPPAAYNEHAQVAEQGLDDIFDFSFADERGKGVKVLYMKPKMAL